MGEDDGTQNNHQHNHPPSLDISFDVIPLNSSLSSFDDDGRPKRTGTVWTASAHIITCVIGSGVLSLAWAIAQLGWVAGPSVMLMFSFVIYYTSVFLTDCYCSGDPVTGKRNYTYMNAIRSNLGGFQVKMCGFIQYLNLFGIAIGYTIAASISMMAVKKSSCFHKSAGRDPCHMSSTPFMILFGITEILLSQIPDFDQLWWLSIVAAVMSFTCSSLGLGLGAAKVVANGRFKGSLTGVSIGTVTETQKVLRSFHALGNIAFSYSFSVILIEIQGTIRSPPREAKTMKKATFLSVIVTTTFYMLCGCMGYAAFGDSVPGNILTGFGLFEPYWVVDIANIAIVVHLVGAYQVICQPLYSFIEKWAAKAWPQAFVIVSTIMSLVLPFFESVVGLIGAIGFWPLTVYFPVQMYIIQTGIPKWSRKWACLQILSVVCLVISLAAAAGSVAGMVQNLKVYKPFKSG